MNNIRAQVNPIHELDRVLTSLLKIIDSKNISDEHYDKIMESFVNLAHVIEELKLEQEQELEQEKTIIEQK